MLESIKLLPEAEIATIFHDFTDEEAIELMYEWRGFWARPSQIAPDGEWRTWLVLAGRGFGKTRCGSEWVREQVYAGKKRIALLAPTAADARDVIVEGESGLLSVFPPHEIPLYEPSKRRITFHTGAIATTFSADEPERLRGPQHDCAWVDELGAYKYPQEALDMLLFGLRLGLDPRLIITTTPKNIPAIKDLVKDETTTVTRGSTYENKENLAAPFLKTIMSKYEDTRLGRQEIYAEILDDAEGALWNRDMLEKNRVRKVPELVRIVVGIDPAISKTKKSNETGIVVAALGANGHGYVLDDRSLKGSPKEWAQRAIDAYYDHEADRIVPEINQGGDMVIHTIRTIDEKVPIKGVRASKGKQARAEPIAALYEQGKVHHVGYFAALEDQMTNWEPNSGDESPDRLDALVWSLTELMLGHKPKPKPDLSGIELSKGSTWGEV